MANGAVVRLLELPPEHSEATTGTPGTAAAEVEAAIGSAMADAAEIACAAIVECAAVGAMSPATRMASGEYLGRVCEVRLAHFGEIDLTAAAAEAKRVLRQRHAGAFRQQNGADLSELALDEAVNFVITVTNQVCAVERVLRAN